MSMMANNTVVTNNERGLTLIELMIAATISVVATAGMGFIYQSQQGEFERQKMVSELDATGRLAVNHMAKRIRLARVGSDPTAALLTACACQISFDSNQRGVYTFLPIMTPDTPQGQTTTIQVTSTAGFAVGDRVSLTSWTVTPTWRARTIQAIGAGPPTLTLNPALNQSFPSFPRGSGVFQTFTTTFALHLTQRQLLQNNSLALASNARMNANGYPPSGVALFRYFNQANTELVPPGTGTCLTRCLTESDRTMVREVEIALPMESPRVTNRVTNQRSTVTHQTRVKLRLPSPS